MDSEVGHIKTTTKMQINPCFILGVPRSGTTLLRTILDSHSQIVAPPETPWLLGGYTDNSFRHFLEYLIYSKQGPYQNKIVSKQQVLFDGARAMLDILFSDLLEMHKKERFVLKTPDDIRYLEFFDKLFPGARYIHIVRDGRDVACSTVKQRDRLGILTGYGEITYQNALQRWVDWEKKLQIFFDDLNGKDRCRHITYESLVLSPDHTMKKICSLLEVEYEESMLHYSLFEHTYPSWEAGSTDVKNKSIIEESSIGNWKQEIDSHSARIIENLYGDFLREKGY